MEKAGWAHSLPRHRYKRGEPVEVKRNGGACYRFCDQVSAHTMRRTTITNLLLMGMEEAHVRKISGHAPGSKEFYRYVVITQDRVDEQYLAANERLMASGYQTEAPKRQVRVQGRGRQMAG